MMQSSNAESIFQSAVFNKDLSALEAILEAHPGLIAELEADGSSLLHRLMDSFSAAIPLLISHGVNIDALDSSGLTPLQVSCGVATLDSSISGVVTQTLLEYGARVDVRDENGSTPLHYLATQMIEDSRIAAAKSLLLMDYGADINATDNKGFAPLGMAYYSGNREVARLLRNLGAPFGDASCAIPSDLHWAIFEEDPARVLALLIEGCDIEARDLCGQTPLHLAAHTGALEIARQLLQSGADLSAIVGEVDLDWQGLTPLHIAYDHPSMVALLLDAGASTTIRGGEYNETPIEHALRTTWIASEGRNASILLSLQRDVMVSKEWLDGTASSAAHAGDSELLAILLKNGASVDQAALQHLVGRATCCNGFACIPTLHRFGAELSVNDAARWASIDALREVLDRGGDPNELYVEMRSMTNEQYQEWLAGMRQAGLAPRCHISTALIGAATFGNAETVRLLLDCGADPNRNVEEMITTPLLSAIGRNNAAMVALLLEHGADPFCKDDRGYTPLQLADARGFTECAAKLRDAEAKLQ